LYILSNGKAGAKAGVLFVGNRETIRMTKKKAPDPVKTAHDQAEKDILSDPELSDSDPTDDLDEGELAQKDNSDEEAFDALEKKRHSGKGSEK
jgi:hypothetical protein